MEDKLKGILGFLGCIYVLVAQIMAIVFFIAYCKTDPLWEIIFVDSFISEFKGLLWIFFIW